MFNFDTEDNYVLPVEGGEGTGVLLCVSVHVCVCVCSVRASVFMCVRRGACSKTLTQRTNCVLSAGCGEGTGRAHCNVYVSSSVVCLAADTCNGLLAAGTRIEARMHTPRLAQAVQCPYARAHTHTQSRTHTHPAGNVASVVCLAADTRYGLLAACTSDGRVTVFKHIPPKDGEPSIDLGKDWEAEPAFSVSLTPYFDNALLPAAAAKGW